MKLEDREVQVEGVRICCHTGKSRRTLHVVTFAHGTGGLIVRLSNGVIGHESFYVPGKEQVNCLIEKGWHACAGIPGEWDALYIPGEAMAQVFHAIQRELVEEKADA